MKVSSSMGLYSFTRQSSGITASKGKVTVTFNFGTKILPRTRFVPRLSLFSLSGWQWSYTRHNCYTCNNNRGQHCKLVQASFRIFSTRAFHWPIRKNSIRNKPLKVSIEQWELSIALDNEYSPKEQISPASAASLRWSLEVGGVKSATVNTRWMRTGKRGELRLLHLHLHFCILCASPRRLVERVPYSQYIVDSSHFVRWVPVWLVVTRQSARCISDKA